MKIHRYLLTALSTLQIVALFAAPLLNSQLFAAPSASSAEANPTISGCLVTIIDEAQVPAQEAGVLVKINVHEGEQVKRGDVLAQIDDMQVQIQKIAAEAEERGAREKANSDVDFRFAVKAEALAIVEHERSLRANARTPGSIPQIEVDRLKLAADKAGLQKEQALIERKIQSYTADNKAAEVKGAANNMERRQVRSPLDGLVVRVNTHAGEWVKPGDTVLHVVQVDRVRVEGYVSASKYNPDEISGREVAVDVTLARGQKVRFPGRVVFVNPLNEAGDNFRILAEVQNRQGPNQQWLLRPGLTADMTIDVTSAGPVKITRDMSPDGLRTDGPRR